MKHVHSERDEVREVVDECVQRSPEVASFRELLELACRQAAANAVIAEPASASPQASPEAPQPAELLTYDAPPSPAPSMRSSVVVGEVMETQHPLRPGRVLVSWRDAQRQTMTEWLLPERHLTLRAGDRVLLALPEGWNEFIVTGALGGEPTAPQAPPEHERRVTLQPGEVVRFVGHDGQPLVTVRQSPDGPVVELGEGNVELKAARTLRLSAQKVEITASTGIDVRADGDTVVRGRTIRLN